MPFWRDERVINYAIQIISALLIIGFVVFMILNFANAAEQRGLRLGYGFIDESAGFPIGESVVDYDPSMSFGRAFLVGLLNTLKVSLLGILAATILGTLVGLARLSPNWLLSQIALAYIEFHRNIPLLVLLFLWFFAVFQKLPPVEESIAWPGPFYLNQRGVYLTWFNLSPGGWIFLISILLGIVLAVLAWITLEKLQESTGFSTNRWIVIPAILILIPIVGWFLSGGSPGEITIPEIEGFNFRGGLRLTPEFTALFVGLVMYTAAFIAEVVRAGIQSVDRGQIEAALSLGLKTTQVLRLILIPQALRVITPPLISQYLNLTKNSSLAIAIGYPDLFSVGRIMINQAGRAVSVFSMVMGTYLIISLITSLFLNIYNRRIQIVER